MRSETSRLEAHGTGVENMRISRNVGHLGYLGRRDLLASVLPLVFNLVQALISYCIDIKGGPVTCFQAHIVRGMVEASAMEVSRMKVNESIGRSRRRTILE